jgi:tellurite resistance protein TerC
MQVAPWAWALFGAVVLSMLALDLGLLGAGRARKRDRVVGEPAAPSIRSAALWSAAWIGLALLFGLVVLALYGRGPALTYLTAYLLEKSLSVDNIFVFVLIFNELGIPAAYQRSVLYWGVFGALVMRALLIAGSIYLLARFHWVIYPFAALIIFAAVRMIWGQEKQREIVVKSCNVCSSWVARFIPITPVLHGSRFWVRQNGRLVATPLLVALVVIEASDLVFALDSIPAVLSITRDPFLVYTSNVFAMLGLRSLYFLLAGAVARFQYLRFGLAAILAFVGAKMLLGDVVEVPNWASLGVIAGALTVAVIASLVARQRDVERVST